MIELKKPKVNDLIALLGQSSESDQLLFVLHHKLFEIASVGLTEKMREDVPWQAKLLQGNPTAARILNGAIMDVSIDELADFCFILGSKLEIKISDSHVATRLQNIKEMAKLMGHKLTLTNVTPEVPAYLTETQVPPKDRLHRLQESKGLSLSRIHRWTLTHAYLQKVLESKISVRLLVEDLPDESEEYVTKVFSGKFEDLQMSDLIKLLIKSGFEFEFLFKDVNGNRETINTDWRNYCGQIKQDYESKMKTIETNMNRLMNVNSLLKASSN